MALAARSIRIEAPIPGKVAVGIEIPNEDIPSRCGGSSTRCRLTFALGRDVAGRAHQVELYVPHLLIAGATGSTRA